jgi:UDP-glucuronate 4-epimerase
MIGHVYSQLYGIRFLALRFFTVYGPGQRPDLAINKFFHSIMNDEPLTVFGDGSTSRDYTYVDDVVSGILGAVGYNRTNFEIINLGNNNLITLEYLINTIEDICDKKALINRFAEQPGDVRKTCADITKARKLLNYEPKTGLREGLLNFFSWWKVYNKF